MSLADALNPHISESIPSGDVYPTQDTDQPATVDQDEEMDDLFDEDAVVDQAERYSISPTFHATVYSSTVRGNSLTDTRLCQTADRQMRFLMPNSVIERQWNTLRKRNQIRMTTMVC